MTDSQPTKIIAIQGNTSLGRSLRTQAAKARAKRNNTTKLLAICGVNSLIHDYNWRGWQKDIEQNPNYVGSFHLPTYNYLQEEKILAAIDDIVDELTTDNQPTILLGHSYGGILARAALSRLTPEQAEHILGVVTMASPHQMPSWYGGIGQVRDKLDLSVLPDVPFWSFGGYADAIVPFGMSHLDPDERHHTNLTSEHVGFMYLPKLRQQVMQGIDSIRNGEVTTLTPLHH